MKSGANYIVLAKIDVNIDDIDEVIFTFKAKKEVTKSYPIDVEYSGGVFAIPLYQRDTLDLNGYVVCEAQANYKSGAVCKSEIANMYVGTSLATKAVENDNPAMIDLKDLDFEIVGNAIIAKMDANPEEIEKAVEDYLDKHPIESGITAEECLQIMTDFYAEHYSELKGEKGDKGDDGAKGADGYTPKKNIDYFDGKDGHTPVKGIDYWTSHDKAEIVNEVLNAMPAAEGGAY